MGQVILEIPQNINRTFRIESEKKAADILEQLEESNERLKKFEKLVASGAIKLPTSKFSDEDDEVLGIWADRPESGQEIARKIRDRNNGKIS
jgi:hypothetical protein